MNDKKQPELTPAEANTNSPELIGRRQFKGLYTEADKANLVIGHHESDLYLRDTTAAQELCRSHGAKFTVFRDLRDGNLALDVPFAYAPFWEAKGVVDRAVEAFESPESPVTIEDFAALVEKDTIHRLHFDNLACPANLDGAKTVIVPGRKYDKVDQGGSGRFMVEKATGEIFGIKGYGKVHRGHRSGTLETIHEFYWGGYGRGVRRSFKRDADKKLLARLQEAYAKRPDADNTKLIARIERLRTEIAEEEV